MGGKDEKHNASQAPPTPSAKEADKPVPLKDSPPPTPSNNHQEAKGKGKTIQVDLSNCFNTYKCEINVTNTQTNREELLSMFKLMTRIRRMETSADNLYKQKLIRGFCHLYNGQEAIAAGVEAAITPKDSIITAYRDHGLMVGRGSDPKGVLAELMMRETGCSKGKGGSMHMFDLPKRFWVVTVSSVLRHLLEQELRSRISTSALAQSHSRSTEMVPPTRDNCMRLSTWHNCGSSLSSLSARTISTPWVLPSLEVLPIRTTIHAPTSFLELRLTV